MEIIKIDGKTLWAIDYIRIHPDGKKAKCYHISTMEELRNEMETQYNLLDIRWIVTKITHADKFDLALYNVWNRHHGKITIRKKATKKKI